MNAKNFTALKWSVSAASLLAVSLLAVSLLAVSLVWVPSTFAATQMQNLENALMCKCDDKCGKVMINCTCDTSKQTRKDYQKHLDSGLTVDQVIKIYVDKYGETVLSAPTKSGFNLTAWIMPFAALVIGGVGVRKIIHQWAGKSEAELSQPESDEAEASSDETSKYSSRLKKELDKLED